MSQSSPASSGDANIQLRLGTTKLGASSTSLGYMVPATKLRVPRNKFTGEQTPEEQVHQKEDKTPTNIRRRINSPDRKGI